MPRQKPQTITGAFSDARASYDIGRESRFRRRRTGVHPTGSGGNYHIQSEREYFAGIELARDLERNNEIVGPAVRRVRTNVVQGGFRLAPNTGDEGLNTELKARWDAFAEDAEQVDLAGEYTWPDIEGEVFQRVLVDGDHFVLPTRDGPLERLESHRCKTPSNARGRKEAVVHGVVLDRNSRRKEYWFTLDDVGPMGRVERVNDVRKIDARDADGNRNVLHIYRKERCSLTRGITALAPVGNTADMTGDLSFAMLVKAQAAACYTIIHEWDAHSPLAAAVSRLAEEDPTTIQERIGDVTRNLGGMGPGTEIFGYPGEKIQGFSPNIPGDQFFDHMALLMTFISINLDLPLAVLLLDGSKTNFSGWRGAVDQARMSWANHQQWLIRSLHRPVYRHKVRQWIAEDPAMDRASIFQHDWHPPGWRYIEPLKDASADLLQLRNCMTSHRRRCHDRGFDWPTLANEIVEDNALLIRTAHEKAEALSDELGIKIDWTTLAMLPTPDGVSMKLPSPNTSDDEQEQSTDADK